MAVNQTRLPYRPDIDGLRAVAVLVVVIFHAFPRWIKGGFVGVDIFFVISGYLISGLIFHELNQNTFSLLDFYNRRIKRILPALILVLATCIGLGWITLWTEEFQSLGRHISAGAGFFSNMLLLNETGYFDKEATLKPLLHLWSLGIEEQFYIIWPILVFLVWKLKFNLFAVLFLIALFSFSINLSLIHNHENAAFYLAFSRFWELLIGSMLAYLSLFKPKQTFTQIRNFKSILGFLFLLVSFIFINKDKYYPGWWTLLPIIGTALIISAGEKATINAKLFSTRWLVFIGMISYPLYLWHWPLLSFLFINWISRPSDLIKIGCILFSILLAYLTYKFIEKPIRYGKPHLLKPILLSAILIIIGASGFAISWNKGFPHRFQGNKQKMDAMYSMNFLNDDEKQITVKKFPCDHLEIPSKFGYCSKTKEGTPTKALWGDSHAGHLFNGIARFTDKNNWLMIAHLGCPPLSGVKTYNSERMEINKNILNYLIQRKEIHTIVLASRYSVDYMDFSKTRMELMPSESAKTNLDIFFYGIKNTIEILEKAGKKVILFQDIPELPFPPMQFIGRPFSIFGTTKKWTLSKESVNLAQFPYKAKLLQLKKSHRNLEIFDSTQYMCNEQDCLIAKDNKLLYRDKNHLNIYGSDFISKPFLAWVTGIEKR